jgi:hypothetical protein
MGVYNADIYVFGKLKGGCVWVQQNWCDVNTGKTTVSLWMIDLRRTHGKFGSFCKPKHGGVNVLYSVMCKFKA